jgi:UDP-GlcNAc:undecaprenyl-phosphate GlcNAc-1-phosphate transferase
VREYLLTLVVAAAVTYLMTPVARRLALRWGAMTEVRDRDVHAIPTPRLGGVAMLAGLAASLLVALHLPFLGPTLGEHHAHDIRALLSGAVLICLLGVADDKWELDAITKLAGQVLVAGVLVLQGVQMLYLPVGGIGGASDGSPGAFVLGPAEGTVLTVLIVVATINAVNFVDGLDGLAAGIVAIAATSFFAFSYLLAIDQNLDRATTSGIIAASLMGICFGFLPHNFSPARIFMGDSGSMLLGLLLASTTITLTGTVNPNDVSGANIAPALVPLVLPIAVMVVPFVDMLLAIIRRTRAGRSPFAPDKQHIHHRLLEIGHSHARAVIVMYLWSAVISYAATAFVFLHAVALIISLTAVSLVALTLTLKLPRLRRDEGSFTGLWRVRR